MECVAPIWDAVLLGMAFASVPLVLLALAWLAERVIPKAWAERLFGDSYTGEEEEP